jgi:hypothetical protein
MNNLGQGIRPQGKFIFMVSLSGIYSQIPKDIHILLFLPLWEGRMGKFLSTALTKVNSIKTLNINMQQIQIHRALSKQKMKKVD